MTTLELQLQRLQKEAPAQGLAVSRDYSSLLFDEKESSNYTQDQYYDIGISGLSHLCKFDADFDKYEANLFDRSKLDQNRALLQRDDNDELNKSVQRMIVRLSPYFHYFACKQVLEWLIHKFKIHKFNAEFLAIALLPHHASNSYGRLLKILRFQDPMWSFTKQYAQDAAPVPMNVLMRVCHAKNLVGASLITAYSRYLIDAVKLVGDEFAARKLHTSFTFFAAFMINLFEDPAKVDDQLIARAIPDVAVALSSKVLPFKFAGLMVTSRIVLSVQLNDEFVANMLKLTLLKMKEPWLEAAVDTALLICQKQNVTSLPRKATLKLLNNRGDFDFVATLKKRIELYDVSDFLSALWATLFSVLQEEMEKVERRVLVGAMVELLEMERLTDEDAHRFFHALLAALAAARDASSQIVPKVLRKHVHAMVIRFATVFDGIRAEWMVRDREVLDHLMNVCEIKPHEVGEMTIKRSRRRRTSSCGSLRRSFSTPDDATLISEVHEDADNLITEEEKIKNAQAQVAEHRPAFRKGVMKILGMVEEKSDTEEIEWALKSLNDSAYVRRQTATDLEHFFLKMLLHVSRNPKFPAKVKLKMALSQIKLNVDVIGLLLSDLTSFEPTPKRSKLAVKSVDEQIAAIFVGESCVECQRRIVFTLEVLVTSSAVDFGAMATETTVRRLVDVIDRQQGRIINSSTNTAEKDTCAYIQQLGLVIIKKILAPNGSKFTAKESVVDNHMLSALVNVIRFAHTPTVLRSALGVLELVAWVKPNETVTQFMTLFTFMGDGVLRRDDETTLRIFEETLHTLFRAILGYDQPNKNGFYECGDAQSNCKHKINNIMRIFTKSLSDIPQHRCVRLLRAVLTFVPNETLWIVLFILIEDYCVRWQSAKKSGQKIDQHFDDQILELVAELPTDKQIRSMQDFSDQLKTLNGDSVTEPSPMTELMDDVIPSGVQPTDPSLVVFDPAIHSENTVRHFRFIAYRFMTKCLKSIAALKKCQKPPAAAVKNA